MNSRGDGFTYPTSQDQLRGPSYDAMGDTNTANRLDVQPTDKLIAAQSSNLNNHHHPQPQPPHLELENGHLIPSSQVIVNVEPPTMATTATGTKTVIDMIGDTSGVPPPHHHLHHHHSKDANGGLPRTVEIELDKIV